MDLRLHGGQFGGGINKNKDISVSDTTLTTSDFIPVIKELEVPISGGLLPQIVTKKYVVTYYPGTYFNMALYNKDTMVKEWEGRISEDIHAATQQQPEQTLYHEGLDCLLFTTIHPGGGGGAWARFNLEDKTFDNGTDTGSGNGTVSLSLIENTNYLAVYNSTGNRIEIFDLADKNFLTVPIVTIFSPPSTAALGKSVQVEDVIYMCQGTDLHVINKDNWSLLRTLPSFLTSGDRSWLLKDSSTIYSLSNDALHEHNITGQTAIENRRLQFPPGAFVGTWSDGDMFYHGKDKNVYITTNNGTGHVLRHVQNTSTVTIEIYNNTGLIWYCGKYYRNGVAEWGYIQNAMENDFARLDLVGTLKLK